MRKKRYKPINKEKLIFELFPFLTNTSNMCYTTYSIDELFDKFILSADDDLKKKHKGFFSKIKRVHGIES